MKSTLALLGTCLALSSASALAQGKRLAIIDVATPPTMMGLGAQVTQTVVTAAEAQGYRIKQPAEIKAQLGPEAYAEVQRCKGSAACVSSKLQGVVADRVVVGSLDRDEKSYLVKLWLIDLTTADLISDVDRQILIASRRLTQDVTEAVPRLLRGEKDARGKLRLTATTKGVSVLVDGEPVGKTPLLVELKPGKHQLKAEKKAYYPVERYIIVVANETTEEEVRMVKIPGQVADDEVLPELARPQVVAQAEPGPPRAAVALGVGAAVLAGGGGFFVLSYRDEVREKGPAYRDGELGKSDRLSATLLLSGAGAAAAAAAILGFALDDDAPVQATGAAAPGAGGVIVQGRF